MKKQYKPLDVLISDKLLRALSSTRRSRDTANTRSEIVIVYKLLPLGEHKVQGVILIPESIDIDLAEIGALKEKSCA